MTVRWEPKPPPPGRELHRLPHPAYVCSGPQLDRVIADMEDGSMALPPEAIWRDDLPYQQAWRLAKATGASDGQISDLLRERDGED